MRSILGNRFQRRNTEKDDTHSTGVSNTPVLPKLRRPRPGGAKLKTQLSSNCRSACTEDKEHEQGRANDLVRTS